MKSLDEPESINKLSFGISLRIFDNKEINLSASIFSYLHTSHHITEIRTILKSFLNSIELDLNVLT